MRQVQDRLKEISDVRTVPNLFIGGQSKGGCNAIKTLEHSGELLGLLSPHIGSMSAKCKPLTMFALFWFPETVNRHVTRLTSALSCIVCIFCVAFYRRSATPWVMLALALDYLVRLVYGASHSAVGAIAQMILVPVDAKFMAGPPKQFAAFCGLFFSTFSAALYISGFDVGGAVVAAALMGASGLEGAFDICLGCIFFGLAISFKIVSPLVYTPYLNMVDDRKWAYSYVTTKHDFPKAHNEHVMMDGQTENTPVDLVRKDRLEFEYKLRDFDMVRHCRVDFFFIPMALAAMSFAFKITDNETSDVIELGTGIAHQVLAILSVIIFGLLGFLYILRALMYPQKVIKEWHHPIFGNFFSAFSICITLFGILFLPYEETGGIALIWIGSVLQLTIALFRVSKLVYERVADEMLNPSLMFAPVGCFLSALGFVQYALPYGALSNVLGINYVELARL